MAKNDILTYEQVREMFDYDEGTGILTWKIKHGYKYPGDEVGYTHRNGYRILDWGRTDITIHRIIWLWFNGNYPLQYIDHINGIRDDNRICNLRDVSQRENTHNKKEHREGKKPGAFYNKWEQRWDARIYYEGKQYRLGMYDTEELALEAYALAQEEINNGILPTYRQPKNKYRRFTKDLSIEKGQRHNYGKKLI